MSVNLILIIATAVLSIVSFSNYDLKYKLIFSPAIIVERKEWFRFLSSGFIHADWIHLGVNMFVLWSFGNAVEHYFKYFLPFPALNYLMLYLLTIVLANLKTFYKERNNGAYFSLGASGGVSGVVFSSIMFNPFSNVYLYAAIPIPGWAMGIGYLILSNYLSKKGKDNINHDAHFWGAIVGIVYTLVQRPQLVLEHWEKIIG